MNPGKFISRWRWPVIAAWLALAGALLLWVPPVSPYATETGAILPDNTPSQRASEALRKHFPDSGSVSDAVVVFERQNGPLTKEDKSCIEHVAGRILEPRSEIASADLDGVTVRSPGSIPLPSSPLISRVSDQGQAALVVVGFPVDYLTSRSARLVDHIDWVLTHETLPQGLRASVTGSAGFGHDYLLAADRSNLRAKYVTLAAVIVILLLVYRAPLAVLVPLGSISLAAVISLKFLDLAAHWGQNTGTAGRIFVFVLLYGAGTDYALLLFSRYREFLRESVPAAQAAGKALNATWSAVAASGLTNVGGMLLLLTAGYEIFRTMGLLVAACLAITLLVSLTLVPALLAVLGRFVFWPRRSALTSERQAQQPGGAGPRRGTSLWPRIARLVTVRPGLVLIVGLGALAAPAAMGARTPWVYDAMAAIGNQYDAVQGADMVKRHWPLGQISPLTVLIETPTPMTDEQAAVLSQQVTGAALGADGVQDARSLSTPLGREYTFLDPVPGSVPGVGLALPPPSLPTTGMNHRLLVGLAFPSSPAAAGLADLAATLVVTPFQPRLVAGVASARALIWREAKKEYLGQDRRAIRVVVVLDQPALTLKAMDVAERVRQAAESAARPLQPQVQVMLVGVTVAMADIRTLTQDDFRRIAVLVLCLILAVVFTLLRDVLLCLFAVFCTVLGYLATLGASYGVFVGLLGQEGLDWKVQLFLFVVMVAVGVDYSIFLMARLKQEMRGTAGLQAIREAIIHTGPVISSCGIIMAATLGSPMAGDLRLLHQLGFAMATGMLVDTFVVRPLLLPSFAALNLRWKASRKR